MNNSRQSVFIIDAYNIIHRVPQLASLLTKDLGTARTGLLRFCANWLASRKDVGLFNVVFDGQSDVTDYDYQPCPGIKTVYTDTGEQADTRILKIIQERHDCAITVVSDDNFVRKHARDLKASVMSASEFFSTPSRRQDLSANSNNDKENLSPGQIKDINDSLKAVWGIE